VATENVNFLYRKLKQIVLETAPQRLQFTKIVKLLGRGQACCQTRK
jgi:hypothetical protein